MNKITIDKGTVIKRAPTLLLQGVVILIGLVVLAICIFVLPPGIVAELNGDFDYGPIIVGLYVPAIPFFVALYQSLILLRAIDHNQAFSHVSVIALKKITYCALIISTLFAIGMPYIFYVAQRDDAPGLAALGLVIIGASFVIAVFAAILQRLLQDALRIQSENELTV